MHSPGDCLIGSKSYCGVEGREILKATATGYEWRILGEKKIRHSSGVDPFFQMQCWIKIPMAKEKPTIAKLKASLEASNKALQELTAEKELLERENSALKQQLSQYN